MYAIRSYYERIGARGALGQDQVADLGARVPHPHLDVPAFGGGANGGTPADGDAVRKVFEALLGTGAALPLLKEP